MTSPPPSIVSTGRRLLESYMLDRAVVSDKGQIRTSGGTTATWTPRAGDPYPCRFGSVTDKEAAQAEGLVSSTAVSVVSFPVGMPPVTDGAKILNVATGKEWLVVGNVTPESVMQLQIRLLITEAGGNAPAPYQFPSATSYPSPNVFPSEE